MGSLLILTDRILLWLIWVGSTPLGRFVRRVHEVAKMLYDERSFLEDVGADGIDPLIELLIMNIMIL